MAELVVVEIGLREARPALDVFARFGNGVHPARLAMGGDFSLMDIEAA